MRQVKDLSSCRSMPKWPSRARKPGPSFVVRATVGEQLDRDLEMFSELDWRRC